MWGVSPVAQQVPPLASLSGLKDLALPQAVEQVADVIQIWCCHGFSIGWQLQL